MTHFITTFPPNLFWSATLLSRPASEKALQGPGEGLLVCRQHWPLQHLVLLRTLPEKQAESCAL